MDTTPNDQTNFDIINFTEGELGGLNKSSEDESPSFIPDDHEHGETGFLPPIKVHHRNQGVR